MHPLYLVSSARGRCVLTIHPVSGQIVQDPAIGSPYLGGSGLAPGMKDEGAHGSLHQVLSTVKPRAQYVTPLLNVVTAPTHYGIRHGRHRKPLCHRYMPSGELEIASRGTVLSRPGRSRHHTGLRSIPALRGSTSSPKEYTMRVLLVEDERTLAATLERGLRREGMAVDIAYDGDDGLEKARINSYEVVVLDRDLPVVHGDDVCRTLVAEGSPARILMLTASGEIDARIEGLSLGADDYLPKPFAFAELVARMRALQRRPASPARRVLAHGDIELDRGRRSATRNERDLELTRKELGVLEVLLDARGRVVSAEELLERVWDEHADPFTNAVRVTIMTLRRKLGDPPVIETVIGEGYRI
jgi:DNA-binding response OmpR family regulator